MCIFSSPFQKEGFTSSSDNQAFISAQLIIYLSCSFFFFLTTFKSVDAAEIWLVTISSCRYSADQEKMRKTIYLNYEEKKLYIHEEGVSNKGGVQATETVSHRVMGN